ncbi:glycosyltransferase family 4 protein [Acidovorax sp. 210-6]|uniref:glycosyltransferase n=1 Tax=Acidovorax sp. 210-6 TaxID=2699468 RepID=UPI001389559F|nr:glycosyltransferase [Acidovorax sp. 210-6]NCU65123.1 glycosyltransferase family 4 protein [Acidovorax sp. 210-6]
MYSLHITLTELRNESRLLKEATSLVQSKTMDAVLIAALHADGLLKDENFGPQIQAHRFALTTRNFGKNFLVQLVKYFEFCFRVYASHRKKGINCINIHSLGLLPLGVMLKKCWKAKLVYDTHELETEKSGDAGMRKKLGKWLERWLIKQVDMTIVVGENIADWYANEYGIARPLVVLNAPKKRKLKKTNHFREQLGIRDDQIILLYQGGLAVGRGVHLILDAFKARQDDKVVTVFMGYGPLQKDIQAAAAQQQNIFFYPAVAPQVVLEYTASADLGIHLIQNSCLNHDYCMPNKLFEYAMGGLPVLVSNMKDMSELVSENQMGAVISDFSAAGINRAIDDFLKQDLTAMKTNAYRVACQHAWEVQEQKMLAAYQSIGFDSRNAQGANQ